LNALKETDSFGEKVGAGAGMAGKNFIENGSRVWNTYAHPVDTLKRAKDAWQRGFAAPEQEQPIPDYVQKKIDSGSISAEQAKEAIIILNNLEDPSRFGFPQRDSRTSLTQEQYNTLKDKLLALRSTNKWGIADIIENQYQDQYPEVFPKIEETDSEKSSIETEAPPPKEDSPIDKSIESFKSTANAFGYETSLDGKQITIDMDKLAKGDANLGKLEQNLDRLVAGKFVDEFKESASVESDDNAKLDYTEAGKILNISANTTSIIEGKNINFMDEWSKQGEPKISELAKDLFEYKDNTLVIKDTERYNKVLDILKQHADELAEQGKMDGAIAYTRNIDQATWEKIAQAREKGISVEDFKNNSEVQKRWDVLQEHKTDTAKEAATDFIGSTDEINLSETVVAQEESQSYTQNLLEKEEMTSEEKAIAQAIKNYNGEVVEGVNVKSSQEQAEKTLLESAKSDKFDEMLKYNDYKESMMNVMDSTLDHEMRRGEGWRHFGSPDTEKLFDFSNKFARLHGLDEQGSKIFSSWLAGDDNVLDRDDFKRLGLWAQEGDGAVKKNHFHSGAFARKVDEFEEIVKSKELPGKNWEPRTIHYADRDGTKHAEIMNVRKSPENDDEYELDNNGDKQPNSDPRVKNGPAWRCPKKYIENWLNEPAETEAEIAQAAPAAETDFAVESVLEGSTTPAAKPASDVDASPVAEPAVPETSTPVPDATEVVPEKSVPEEAPKPVQAETVPVAEQEKVPEAAPAETTTEAASSSPEVDFGPSLDSFNLGNSRKLVEEFLEENLDPNGDFARIEAMDNIRVREAALSELSDEEYLKYTRYRIQRVAKDVVVNQNDGGLTKKLRYGLTNSKGVLNDNERTALRKLL